MLNKTDDNNKQYKITTYDNTRARVQINTYNPYEHRTILNIIPPLKVRNFKYPYLTRKQYIKQLKKNKKKLTELKLDANKCCFLTLTTKQLFYWEQIKVKFDSFMRSIKRNFDKTYYIRAIESHENETHFHIHLILMFKNGIPKNFNQLWVKNHWKHGFNDFQKVIEPYGIIDYITNFKEENLNPKNNNYTKFPQFIKVVTRSNDFPLSNKIEIITDYNGLCEHINNLNTKCKQETGQDLFCYNDGHYFVDEETGEYDYCLDNQYYHKPLKME